MEGMTDMEGVTDTCDVEGVTDAEGAEGVSDTGWRVGE